MDHTLATTSGNNHRMENWNFFIILEIKNIKLSKKRWIPFFCIFIGLNFLVLEIKKNQIIEKGMGYFFLIASIDGTGSVLLRYFFYNKLMV